MSFIPSFIRNLYERDNSGKHWYYIDGQGNWGYSGTNLHLSQNHPILTPALLFVSKLYSQAKFKVVDKKGKSVEHWILDILKAPNYYQTQSDFLESQMFMQIAQGKAVLYVKKSLAFKKEINAIYILDSDLMEWPHDFKTKMYSQTPSKSKSLGQTTIIYDGNGENLKIKLKDLLFFYDLPNSLNKDNKFNVKSRIDGLKQTLINTKDSLLAKNIILKTNGKELITGEKDGFPLSSTEKEEAEKLWNTNYGLGSGKKRGLITKASIKWQSLHIALRDLGLDESVKVDGNLIYTALHIPKDILSLEAKKTTYNNYKESMVSYIQNEIQSSLDATILVLQKLIEEKDLKLVGSYEHLPVMQFILIQKYDGISKRAKALNDLLRTGIPKEIALELCDFEKDLVLTELQPIENENNNQQTDNNQSGSESDDEEEE